MKKSTKFQSQTRRKNTKKFCATHNFHYNDVCVFCDHEQAILDAHFRPEGRVVKNYHKTGRSK